MIGDDTVNINDTITFTQEKVAVQNVTSKLSTITYFGESSTYGMNSFKHREYIRGGYTF